MLNFVNKYYFKEVFFIRIKYFSALGGYMLDKYFNYKKHKTDFKTEVIAGTTTFLTMAYIMFLNLWGEPHKQGLNYLLNINKSFFLMIR